MNKTFLMAGAFFGLLAVVIGAFGAHGLKPHLDAASLTTFETGVRYQMYHALLLLFLGVYSGMPLKRAKIVFYLIVFGILFFSGSIYGLSTDNLTGFNVKRIGFITPVGGTLLITAWGILLYDFIRFSSK